MPPVIVVGHYGSGKTEFAANYARALARQGKSPLVADLDIVNPYFRLRESEAAFKEMGVEVVASNLQGHHMDTPALSAGLARCFETEGHSLIDVGGDADGARVLARFSGRVHPSYEMWLCINANRPRSSTPQQVTAHMAAIEATSRLKITGLVNTTHMLNHTTAEDLRRGDQLVRQVAAQTGTPIKYTVFLEGLKPLVDTLAPAGEPFPISLMLRPPWLDASAATGE